MPSAYFFYHFPGLKRYSLLFSVVFFALCFSCGEKKKPSPTGDYSKEFDAIYHNNRIYDVKNADKAMLYLDSAFGKLRYATRNDSFRYYSLHFIFSKKVTHDATKELFFADQMLEIANRCDNEPQYVNFLSEANFAKGDAYFDLGQYNDAYKCYYEGYYLGKNHLNDEIIAEYTYRMGMITFQQGHYGSAVSYFKESYARSAAIKDGFGTFYQRQELLNNIGESYLHKADLDSASQYFDKTLAFINANAETYKNKSNLLAIARAVTYGDQGMVAYQQKKYSAAESLFKKSIAINLQKFNDNYNAESVEITLAHLYFDLQRDEDFNRLMQDLGKQLQTVKNPDAESDWNNLMNSYYLRKNNFATAYKYLKAYDVLKDSLNKAAFSLKGTNIDQQLASYDRQYQIQTLKSHNKTQRIYLYLALLSLLLILVIIFLVIRNWARSRKNLQTTNLLNRQINDQNRSLEQALNELHLSSQEKDRILRTVAHDLRNPLGGIAALAKMMAADEDYNEEQKELVQVIKETSNNTIELINDILEATEGGNDKQHKEKENVELNSLLNNSVELMRFKAAEKKQEIVFDDSEKLIKLPVYREQLWRVVSNLISNAIKFSPKNGLITVKLSEDANSVIISVADNGIGIPDELKDKIFNIFTEAKRPGTSGEKSFGLGLSICRQIIEKHNAEIWFESNPGTGTTFYVSLPKKVRKSIFI